MERCEYGAVFLLDTFGYYSIVGVVLQRQKQEQCTYSLSLGRCLVVIIGYRLLQQENEE